MAAVPVTTVQGAVLQLEGSAHSHTVGFIAVVENSGFLGLPAVRASPLSIAFLLRDTRLGSEALPALQGSSKLTANLL